jgi:hypothetical protein
MTKSTASFIAYDMRPAKQTERRGIIEFLNCAKQSGFILSSYRYVGFGGTKFVDFQLMQKYIGFSSYQSLEHDVDIYERCVFNRPFRSIDVYKGALSQFLTIDAYTGNSMYWLDFEQPVGRDILVDLNSIASRVQDGDLLFVSISGELPPKLAKADGKAGGMSKNAVLRSRIPSLRSAIDKLAPHEFTANNFPKTAGKLLLLMLQSAFAKRIVDGSFHPIFKVVYKDSSWMCTVGGVFLKPKSRRKAKLQSAIAKSVAAMCPTRVNDFYQVPQFNFTQLERILLDKSSIDDGTGYVRRLKALGFTHEHLVEYERMSRFVPKFVETAF